MSKHTPGPWVIDANQPNIVKAPAAGYFIADVFSGHQASKANTQLVSAAPDLLEVAEAIVLAARMGFEPQSVFDENSPLMDAARAAIAKATGEQA
jgi:hypothetical protein